MRRCPGCFGPGARTGGVIPTASCECCRWCACTSCVESNWRSVLGLPRPPTTRGGLIVPPEVKAA